MAVELTWSAALASQALPRWEVGALTVLQTLAGLPGRGMIREKGFSRRFREPEDCGRSGFRSEGSSGTWSL